MARPQMKYNPAFLTDQQIIEGFVVRHAEFESILETLRENTTQSNQHLLVIGPRGSGKTTLVLRVAAEVRRDEDLRRKWHPIVFAEESHQVHSPGEFWLEALLHLSDQPGNEGLKPVYRELHDEQDESRLHERCLGQILDFADEQNKRLLLVVENLNFLLGEQIDQEEAWTLRHTLMNEPRIMLLATATKRFKEIDHVGKAFFELFKTLELKSLDPDGCQAVWKAVTGSELPGQQIRAIHILTGGSPRLLAIISAFAADLSFKHLMDDLTQLIDDHTEYFKKHLEDLAPVERKVYLALAEIWDPATASQIAKHARLSVSKTSAFLSRLQERGAVAVSRNGRRKIYQVAERLYNIYYLMRRHGATAERVGAAVRFMVAFYGDGLDLARLIIQEARELPPEQRQDHYRACYVILRDMDQSRRCEVVKETLREFLTAPDAPEHIRSLAYKADSGAGEKEVEALLERARDLTKTQGNEREVERLLQKVVTLDPKHARHWFDLGMLYKNRLNQPDQARAAFERATEIDPDNALGWIGMAALHHFVLKRFQEAEVAYKRALALAPDAAEGHALYGSLLHGGLSRYDEAEREYRRAIELDPEYAWVHVELGVLMHTLGRPEEAESAFRRAIELEHDNLMAWRQLGLLLDGLERNQDAEEAYRRVAELMPSWAWGWARLGRLYVKLNRYEEAASAYKKALQLDPEYKPALAGTVLCMLHNHKYPQAKAIAHKLTQLAPEKAAGWSLLGLVCQELREFPEAERAYRKALGLDPDDPFGANLAHLLLDTGRGTEALQFATNHLLSEKRTEDDIRETVSMLVRLAAYGFRQEVLEAIERSPSSKNLEPLIVALKMDDGQEVEVAAEIKEIALDVLKQITEMRRAIHQTKPGAVTETDPESRGKKNEA